MSYIFVNFVVVKLIEATSGGGELGSGGTTPTNERGTCIVEETDPTRGGRACYINETAASCSSRGGVFTLGQSCP